MGGRSEVRPMSHEPRLVRCRSSAIKGSLAEDQEGARGLLFARPVQVLTGKGMRQKLAQRGV